MNTNNYVKWDSDIFYIFVLLSKFCKNYPKKSQTRIVHDVDVFKYSCITLDINDLWSVICFPTVKTSVHFQFR